ncbi:MAG: C-GCAxxG-C-C family protein [Atopobiaceae bacterium]|nr:C-GCAxxG-C-C family protein [Atopobiaceae bacterium]MCI1538863.1 C-GCAxxG-C-C family protein [Atopobiaceae bacterium]
MKRFEEAAGAIRCRDLKGIDTGAVLMPCPACVTTAAQILEDVVLSDKE